MKEPKKKMTNGMLSFLIVLACVGISSIILAIAINTASSSTSNIATTIFFSVVALISIVGVISTIILFKNEKGDNEKWIWHNI